MLKVFISSVVVGFEEFREAAASAARALGHEVRRSEDFGASTESPQRVCLEGVRWADLVVVILGARYGVAQASGRSATDEEYREARDTTELIAFLQTGVERDPRQELLVAEIRDWAGGHIAPTFVSPPELRDAVTRGLRDHELRLASQAPDEEEILSRAAAGEPGLGYRGAGLRVAVAGGPKQQIIRPAEIADPGFARTLTQLAMFGVNAVLDSAWGATPHIARGVLGLKSDATELTVDQLGTVQVFHPATRRDGLGALPVVIEEDLEGQVVRDLRLAGEILDLVDSRGRISLIVPVLGLVLGGAGLRTRAEHAASPNSMAMPRNSGPVSVHLTPASRRRAALLHDTVNMAADVLALLKDEVNH